jgi:hypothetical protein
MHIAVSGEKGNESSGSIKLSEFRAKLMGCLFSQKCHTP